MRHEVRLVVKAAVYLCIIGLGANAGSIAVDNPRAQTVPTVKPGPVVVPYTVVLSEVVVGASGTKTTGPSQTWALRSDGATVLKIGEGDKATRLVHYPDGTRVEVSDSLRAKRTLSKLNDPPSHRDPQKMCARPVGPAAANRNESPPTLDTVQGHRAARISMGASTNWYALDAGCALLKRTLGFEAGGASHLELVSLIPGEPSAALFAAPADYREAAAPALAPIP
jgi:hypothetical protein